MGVCVYICTCLVFESVSGAACIPGLMHVGLRIPLPHAACFPRLLVALGSHGTVIYNKDFPAHTLGRGNAPT